MEDKYENVQMKRKGIEWENIQGKIKLKMFKTRILLWLFYEIRRKGN